MGASVGRLGARQDSLEGEHAGADRVQVARAGRGSAKERALGGGAPPQCSAETSGSVLQAVWESVGKKPAPFNGGGCSEA